MDSLKAKVKKRLRCGHLSLTYFSKITQNAFVEQKKMVKKKSEWADIVEKHIY